MNLHEIITHKYEEIGDYEFSGKVARELSALTGHKESNIERRMRELESGWTGSRRNGHPVPITLECKKVQVEGKGPWVTMYKIIPKKVILGVQLPRESISEPVLTRLF